MRLLWLKRLRECLESLEAWITVNDGERTENKESKQVGRTKACVCLVTLFCFCSLPYTL